jgi:acyl-CoA synthetase (AMP-forming)/AMP-acid ligase II
MKETELRDIGVPRSIDARLTALARRRGEVPAFLDANVDVDVTWSEIAAEAYEWSRRLSPGSVVGLHFESPTAFCRSYLAGIAAGLCVAPLDPRATSEEASTLVDILEIADVIVDSEEGLSTLHATGVNLWLRSATGLRRTRMTSQLRPSAPGFAVLLTTSGTTGRPKVVPLTESQLLRAAYRVVKHHEITSADRGLSPLPLFHINAEVIGILSTLVAGSSLVVADRFHRTDFWTVADELRATWLNLVPGILAALENETPPSDTVRQRVRFARSASAPLPIAAMQRFEEQTGIGILETYGMTEAAGQIAANPLLSRMRRPGSVGLPVGVPLRVVDDEGVELAPGEIGAVEIGGQDVVTSYLTRDRTPIPARAPLGWLHTGDLGRRDDEGFLYLTGRVDDVINRGGEKCYPREIEEVLCRDTRVQRVAVIGRPHPILGEEPIAYIVPNEQLRGTRPDLFVNELVALCEKSLSRYKRPASISLVDDLPTGSTGKISRQRLRALVNKELHPAMASAGNVTTDNISPFAPSDGEIAEWNITRSTYQ